MNLLHELFFETAARSPDRIAAVIAGKRYRYSDIQKASESLAAQLARAGVGKGDRVALFLENGIPMLCAIPAVLSIGAIFVPISPLTKTEKLAYILNNAGASAAICEPSLEVVWRPAVGQTPSIKSCLLPESGSDPVVTFCACPGYPEPSGHPMTFRDGDEGVCIDLDLAAIIYTSGSTGNAKGVMLTHLNMRSALRSITTYLGLRQDDVIFCALPLSFDYGLYQWLMAFDLGATVVLEKGFSFPVRALEIMVSERVTVFPGVPTMFSMIMALRSLDAFDLSRVRLVTNTAAALSNQHITRIREVFSAAALFSMYGLTECKRVSYLPPDQLDVRPSSIGRGMPNEEIWLVDADGRRLPNGSTGELVIRGSNVMRGYWQNPDATSACLREDPDSGDRVLHSGDIFRTDEEGWFYFVGRRDDIIKSRGEKVSPKEVENVLHSIEGVQDAAVVGVEDAILGQAVEAYVVPAPGAILAEAQIIRTCQKFLESFMVPRRVHFLSEMPKTVTGKVDKKALPTS